MFEARDDYENLERREARESSLFVEGFGSSVAKCQCQRIEDFSVSNYINLLVPSIQLIVL
ncbi:unnamed protein product [Arabis nemorensis]|uniref:Uncharacterized protein n=1 Tax=Arabis nemorensis TaxID=586526 RepID=A0A565BIR5_9BRAS|nr:unnamed protein product [Arabis nemorensis]